MGMTQLEKDKAYRARQKDLGMAKICVMFPIAFKKRLVEFVAENKKEWEELRDA